MAHSFVKQLTLALILAGFAHLAFKASVDSQGTVNVSADDEAALVQKQFTLKKRTEQPDNPEYSLQEEIMGGMAEGKKPKQLLADNPKLVKYLKKFKPSEEEKMQDRADTNSILAVTAKKGAEYAQPIVKKMQKRKQTRVMEVMKPQMAAAKAFKDLQQELYNDQKEFTNSRFKHTTGVDMNNAQLLVDTLDAKMLGSKSKAESLKRDRIAVLKSGVETAKERQKAKKKKAAAKAARAQAKTEIAAAKKDALAAAKKAKEEAMEEEAREEFKTRSGPRREEKRKAKAAADEAKNAEKEAEKEDAE